MADIRIRFRFDVETGAKEIVVEYDSDPDALPYEHEQRHREIVEMLVGKGVIGVQDAGAVRVERLTAPRSASPDAEAEGEAPEAEAALE